MNISMLRSDLIYRRLMHTSPEEKKEVYRQEIWAPFMKKWEIQQIPFRAETPGGFDVMTLNDMIYMSPHQVDLSIEEQVRAISGDHFWSECKAVVSQSFEVFEQQGIRLPTQNYLFTVLLGNSDSEILKMNEGYLGDGGIPGYILTVLTPNAYTLPRIRSALAHECNHNVRYQFIRWDADVTLGELIVSEGLAENFAVALCGQEGLGPWVAKTDANRLNRVIKPLLQPVLDVKGWGQIASYLYGDEIAKLQGFDPVGAPYGAGYACGYDLIRYYLHATGDTLEQATCRSAEEILQASEGYWNVESFVDRT